VSASAPSSLWFARHEFRLAWREWRAMMAGGRRRRLAFVVIALIAFAALMHLPAWALVTSFADMGSPDDKASLIMVTAAIALYSSLILSQALESVTRAFYARADLDLILSAPVSGRRVFTVRIAAIALAMVGLAMVMAAPVIDILAVQRGSRWLLAFGVVAATGAVATAVALALTVALFRLIGPRRTRIVSQILAAIIGAAFVIGLQVTAILYYGTLAQPSLLLSPAVIVGAPDISNPVWWPARAVMGDPAALIAVGLFAAALLGLTATIFAGRFGDYALAAASAPQSSGRRRRTTGFRVAGPRTTLRRKEWALLRRDSWLASQTLTQLLDLLPPALLLSRSFGNGTSTLVVVIFAMVAVAGQLAGGLAWLAISGEDAPDLVATAPVARGTILGAKIEAVLAAVAIIFAPFLLALLYLHAAYAAIAAGGILIAALSSIRVQLWFRAQARRSHFRRRHTSSRVATFAEGFTSFGWAGAAALAATGSWLAAGSAAFVALLILGGARLVAPKRLML
jgi:ABC-2 type transport system permease protein